MNGIENHDFVFELDIKEEDTYLPLEIKDVIRAPLKELTIYNLPEFTKHRQEITYSVASSNSASVKNFVNINGAMLECRPIQFTDCESHEVVLTAKSPGINHTMKFRPFRVFVVDDETSGSDEEDEEKVTESEVTESHL